MKKLISALLALVMVLGLAATAFAAEITYPQNGSFNKSYLEKNAGSSSPAETFEFTFTPVYTGDYASTSFDSGYVIGATADANANPKVVVAPTITDARVTYDGTTENEQASTAGQSKAISIGLNDITWPVIGVYYYQVAEKEGGTFGVDYDCNADGTDSTATHYLKVSVVYTDDTHTATEAKASFVSTTPKKPGEEGNTTTKDDTIYNIYKATGTITDAGSFSVKKEVKGTMGDEGYSFPINVTFRAASASETNPVKSTITYTDNNGAGTIAPTDWTRATTNDVWTKQVTIYAKHNTTVTFVNVPYDVTYTVQEWTGNGKVPTDGYTVSYTVDNNGQVQTGTADDSGYDDYVSGTIGDGKCTVTVTNSLEADVDTGVVLDNLPYVVLLAVAAAGLFLLLTKKRQTTED